MGEKGEKTKKRICMAAYKLFAEKGYKDVTMKDILSLIHIYYRI